MVEQPAVNRLVVGSSPTCRVLRQPTPNADVKRTCPASGSAARRPPKTVVYSFPLSGVSPCRSSPSTSYPPYCHHRAAGQAYVTLNGQMVYLRAHGTAAAAAQYDRSSPSGSPAVATLRRRRRKSPSPRLSSPSAARPRILSQAGWHVQQRGEEPRLRVSAAAQTLTRGCSTRR